MLKLIKKNTNFRIFFSASIISNIGDYVDDIVFAQLVYLITQSTLFTSYVFAIKMVFTFLSIFMAALADRLNKKKLIVGCYIMQAVVLSIVIAMYKLNKINLLVLIATVTAQALFSSISVPTQNAVLSSIVAPNDVVDARALINVCQRFVQIIAYAASATLVAFIGIEGALLIDIFTFFIAAFFYIFINMDNTSIPFKDFRDYTNEVKQGFLFVKTTPIILSVIICSLIGNFLTSPVDSLMPAYFSQKGFYKSSYSFFMCILTITGAIFGIIITKIKNKMSEVKIFSFGFGMGAIGISLLFFSNFIMSIIAAIFIGGSYTIVSVLNSSILQLRTPKEMIARTFSIFKCSTFLAGPAGMILGGLIGEFFSLNKLCLLIGILMFILTLFCGKILKYK